MTATTEERDAIAAIWAEVLGVPVGEDDDFFLSGGHSLLATQMIARVEDRLGVRVTLRQVLDNAELTEFCELVSLLRRQQAADDQSATTPAGEA
ncbi:phosphopantetheine-binding protein [Micromonospora sp. RP3T]|uniref:phosphopantetheine-binding protein n=1 Tax=Micromonospora sp. RP3T TaxID=2135446 RepID=UPI003D70DBEA